MAVVTYSLKKDGARFLSPHFQVREFRCKDGSDPIFLNTGLIEALERLFSALSCDAINVTSGYRTNTYSKKVGGYAGDQHTRGNAADIWCKKDGKAIPATRICCALEDLGHAGGVGYIDATHVHLDVRGSRVFFDETKGERTTDSWYRYFGISRPAAGETVTRYRVKCLSTWIRRADAPGGLLEIYLRGRIVEGVGISGRYTKIRYGKNGLAYAYIPTEYLERA